MPARRLRGDEGAATTELVLAAPGFLFMILLIVQAGLYFHAIAVASAAAQDGAREASLQGNTIDDGVGAARSLVDALAPELLGDVAVTGEHTDGGDSVRVTVAGEVAQVVRIPGADLSISVRETAETPVERFRPTGDEPVDGP